MASQLVEIPITPINTHRSLYEQAPLQNEGCKHKLSELFSSLIKVPERCAEWMVDSSLYRTIDFMQGNSMTCALACLVLADQFVFIVRQSPPLNRNDIGLLTIAPRVVYAVSSFTSILWNIGCFQRPSRNWCAKILKDPKLMLRINLATAVFTGAFAIGVGACLEKSAGNIGEVCDLLVFNAFSILLGAAMSKLIQNRQAQQLLPEVL